MEIDWKRGLGLDEFYIVTYSMVKRAYDKLYKEANTYNDMRKYGMHVALHTFIVAAEKELIDT